jgi:hypothetical protein
MTSRSNEIGRFVIDIDGCLKSTDLMALAAEDVRRLCHLPCDADQIFWEIYGDLVPLGPGDRVTLSEESVTFFRTRAADSHFTGGRQHRTARPTFSLAA